jgi:hypothetical protein
VNTDIVDRLARIETKLDVVLERASDQEVRLRGVERKQWYHSGGIAAAAFVLTKLGVPWPH